MPEFNNAIINGVLCYISSARKTLSDQTIINICQSFYSSDCIFEAKEILYNFSEDACVKRRGGGRTTADLTDIISLLRKLDENCVSLPSFLAADFLSMPPASGFEVVAGHIVDLMAEMARLREEIECLRKNDGSTSSSDGFTDIKEDIYDIKNILIQKSVSGSNTPFPSPCRPTYAGVLTGLSNSKRPAIGTVGSASPPMAVDARVDTGSVAGAPPRNLLRCCWPVGE